jgi:hypothetical protein
VEVWRVQPNTSRQWPHIAQLVPAAHVQCVQCKQCRERPHIA